MREDYCDISIVLDESGSMLGLQDDTIGGVNGFMKAQRALPGKCTLSLMKFAHDDRPVFTGRPIAEAPDLTHTSYAPSGNTALLDALGRTIEEAGARFKGMADADRPSKVIIVVVTDGQENASQVWTKEKIREAVERQTTQYKWEFVFLGANVDAFSESAGLGMPSSHTLQTHSNRRSVNALYAGLSSNTSSLRGGTSKSMAWTDEQRREQAESKGST